MEQGMEMLFALFGGLAMFLYGMDRMSRALQRAAGDAMKRLLARLTATPLMGVLTGLAVTAVLQSSSAATVMVIGFVSAGLLELPRAVAVIYGINIGTTMTAQLIAFDVQTLVYPVLFLGFLLDFAARRPRWQAVGEAVFSFGLLFEGIDILGRALQPLAGQAVFLDWMTRVKESPLLGILLGLSMTMVVQSSSATIALLQNLARQAGPDGIHSVLGLAGAVPVLLGDNIGTTVTALLACIGQGRDAARAALAHSCFNLTGSLLAAVLLGCKQYVSATAGSLRAQVQSAYAQTLTHQYPLAQQAFRQAAHSARQASKKLGLLVRRNALDRMNETMAVLPQYANPENQADLAVEAARVLAQIDQLEQCFTGTYKTCMPPLLARESSMSFSSSIKVLTSLNWR